jgi:NAD(P)-dependent dehydrogenase (short-subunit alcohol dehydrogenase family)
VADRLHTLHAPQNWLLGWTPARIPDLRGKTAVVTGANSGLGYETARKLAENGCRVIMVCRDAGNGQRAAAAIRASAGKACGELHVEACDLAVLSNVADLVARVRRGEPRLDILVNMAGVFHPGPYARTKDGIEQSLAVNYYAPALLTLGLLDTLRAARGARVVMWVVGLGWVRVKADTA